MFKQGYIFYKGHVIDIGQRGSMLVSSVMEETGGLGVDVVIDNGGMKLEWTFPVFTVKIKITE